MLRHISSGNTWHGERINGVSYPRNIETLWTSEQLAAIGLELVPIPTPPPLTHEQKKALVDEEWSRRVFGGFTFAGEEYHSDRDSIDNITGAQSLAQYAMDNGVQAGNRYWHLEDPANPPEGAAEFAWKSRSNGMIPMDAPTMVALAKALFAWKHAHFLAARSLKDTPGGIPADYTSDIYWP